MFQQEYQKVMNQYEELIQRKNKKSDFYRLNS